MTAAKKISILAFALAFIGFMQCAEDCGETQHNVDNGMIRLPDLSGESIRDLNCSWTYSAPPGRKLLVKVDTVHLPPLELRLSTLQLYLDDKFYDIPRNCVKCLREMVGGRVLKVVFTSNIVSPAEARDINATYSRNDSIGSFQLRYKSFDPLRCSKPEQIENGIIVGKGKKLGQSIFYICNPPYYLIGESSLTCTILAENPVPEWSAKPPECIIQDCTKEPILKVISPGAITTPGYPSYDQDYNIPCTWKIVAQPTQQIKASITYLRLPKDHSYPDNTSRLSLLDGDSYIANLTETVRNTPLNFTTLTNKLTVEFVVEEDRKKEGTGFYMNYDFVSSFCPEPHAPWHGDVIVQSHELETNITYKCWEGYVLVGEDHAECLLNGQWSHPAPTCEPINVQMPSFLSASNDSDTVTAKLSELPEVPETTQQQTFRTSTKLSELPEELELTKQQTFRTSDKLPELPEVPETKQQKDGNKKATESIFAKDGLNSTETQEKSTVPKDFKNSGPPSLPFATVRPNTGKKSEKDHTNGPKSEPHQLQVVPPKINDKKTTNGQTSTSSKPSTNNSTRLKAIPSLDAGFNEEPSLGFFELNKTMIYIIIGVCVPLLVIVFILLVITLYRRRYPVRMRFGRKFSTFENPMYVTKDAQDPRELKRLTKDRFSRTC